MSNAVSIRLAARRRLRSCAVRLMPSRPHLEAPVVKPPVVITDPDLLERMRKDALKAERRAPLLRKLREDLAP